MKEFLKKNKWPLIVAATAIIVRIIYILELSRMPDFAVPMVDEKWHWQWANEILSGSFWGTEAYFRAPLYPYVLAFLSWITSGSILFSKLLQVLFCGFTAWFIYRLAENLFNRKAAILSGFVYALYGTLVFYESMFLIPVIFLFLTVWGMYRLVAFRDSTSIKTWLLTGIIFGLAAIARPNILIVVPFLIAWLYHTTPQELTGVKRLRQPLLLLAGLLIAIAPVTVRNIAVTGDVILISSQGGINLYLGNNTEADGLTMLMPEVDLNESVSWRQFGRVTTAAAESEAGHRLTDAQQSSFWTGKAVDFMLENPGHFLSLIWRKSVYLVSGFENSDNTDIYHQRKKSSLHSLLVWEKPLRFPFGLILPLMLAGVYITRKDFKKLLPLYIFLIAYIPSIVLFLVTARHRLPLVPFVIIIACAGLVSLFKRSQHFTPRNLIVVLALFLIPLVAFNRTYYEEVGVSEFQNRLNEGIRYQRLGDYVRAEQAYMLADREFPYSAVLVNNLAHVQLIQGKYALAEKNLWRAISIDTTYATAYNNMGLLMRQKGKPDSALMFYRRAIVHHDYDREDSTNLGQYRLNIGEAFEAMGALDSAETWYREAIAIQPDQANAWFKLSGFYSRVGDFLKADSMFVAGLQRGEPTASHLFNWGLSYIRRQEYFAAIERMRRVIEIDTTFYQAYYGIAVGFYENQLSIDSVNKYLDMTLRYNPNYRPALELRKMISGGN